MEGPSRTAALTAVARALHREEPPPWVLDDLLAFDLAGVNGEEVRDQLVERLRRPSLLPFIRWVCVRARLPEDVVEDAMLSGVRQYVVLGAGFDTFAYRRRDLMDRGLRVFEVDHPATQEWKRERLRELGIDLPSGWSTRRSISSVKPWSAGLRRLGSTFRCLQCSLGSG